MQNAGAGASAEKSYGVIGVKSKDWGGELLFLKLRRFYCRKRGPKPSQRLRTLFTNGRYNYTGTTKHQGLRGGKL